MNDLHKNKKFHVGKFTITDKNGILSFVGIVEVTASFTKALFWIYFDQFVGEKKGSVAFDSIALRSFAIALKEISYGTTSSYKKISGGNGPIKEIIVTPLERYVLIQYKHLQTDIQFMLDISSLLALTDEIEKLIDITVESTYKTQQYILNKKRKNR